MERLKPAENPARPARDVLDLVDRHIESLYVVDEMGRLRVINDFEGTPPPRLSIVRSSAGNRCLLSDQLPDDLCNELVALAALEPVAADVAPWPVYRERYRALLESHAAVFSEYGGPAFVLPERECASENSARILGPTDQRLLEAHFAWLSQEFADAEPVSGVIEDGAVVAICHCARRRTAAVEAGVETAPAYRGRGLAQHATARWASAMYAANMRPLYSASWANSASLSVAAALGARCYAVDFNLT
ncbi:MAG TPA: GNAT family N-acetyltransferase [Polyangiaceae bacterium]|nr:GNAT family N-acetyltransferase [Polyangiaceae bacterium]